ncbi:hypothetical protein ACHAXR_009047 [Thalassiosira sp. AJA248-18]
MAATAALSAATAAMDIVDNNENNNDQSEKDLVERLANSRIGTSEDDENNNNNNNDTIPMNTSEESTLEDDDLPTPEGFFIDSKSNHHATHESLRNVSQLPSWPATPPSTTTLAPVTISSCPRPSTSSMGSGGARRPTYPRPLFVSSSSGALMPPPQQIEQQSSREDDDINMSCPATRAAAAMEALETTNANNNHHLGLSAETTVENNNNNNGTSLSYDISLNDDISRQETFHTSNQSLDKLGNNNNNNNNNNNLPIDENHALPSPPRTFEAYPSPRRNEPIPQGAPGGGGDIDYDDNVIPSLYTFSSAHLSGRILTTLSRKFVPRHKQHTHGGSALAGFSALLLVTCANYMLGPMRDAAALAVGVHHIPALTLASTVLALGSSVPVGWLFEAPNPMRRRVWKKMGLTRGETQGTSLALFYRVFAFLLLSYALGFKMVDTFGKNKGGGGSSGDDGGDDDDDYNGGDESAIAIVATFCLRLLEVVGIPVTQILTSMEHLLSDILGMPKIISSTGGLHATLELHAQDSIPTLFLHGFKCIVNKFGKVIYIMFFLVVHLMKLHSLSLIWGVTTEAMEYEENAEQRRAAKEKEGGNMGSSRASSSAGGSVMNRTSKRKNDNGGGGSSSNSNSTTTKPSKSSLRLKRLGFVGFGGTLGGILGSVIASFAAHILHLSGLLIVAAILLEISANLSVELGRIMQRHWEEQMKYQSCGDLTALASAENLDGQNAVDSSMRKSVSLGSMKRVASGNFSSSNLAKLAEVEQTQTQQEQKTRRASLPEDNGGGGGGGNSMTRARSIGSISLSSEDARNKQQQVDQQQQQQPMIDDNSFKQRLLRGITTILRSRLLISIFTYNALYASTSVLLSFQRAELVANRSSSGSSAVSNTAFLAKINTASSVSVFVLQASGLGAYIANMCGQRGALALMPIIRLCGVILLGWWHLMSNGQPPDLILFLVIDEFTKVINFAIAKPVRENLWRGLSAEARYEAKPIVDTLANRWGGGSAAFLVSCISRICDLTGLGEVNEKGERSIFGFPPILLLCMIISAWWSAVSADVGNIRRKIDLELKKQQ